MTWPFSEGGEASLGQHAALDARHRAHARIEDRIRTGRDTGLR